MAAAPLTDDGLAVQVVEALDPSKLTPLTPEVISRQVRRMMRTSFDHLSLPMPMTHGKQLGM